MQGFWYWAYGTARDPNIVDIEHTINDNGVIHLPLDDVQTNGACFLLSSIIVRKRRFIGHSTIGAFSVDVYCCRKTWALQLSKHRPRIEQHSDRCGSHRSLPTRRQTTAERLKQTSTRYPLAQQKNKHDATVAVCSGKPQRNLHTINHGMR